jgi:hypothetical protein
MVWEDNIDLGEGIIPSHILNLVCAVHLRQEHGFKRWRISRFKQTYPWLSRDDGTFAFAALHTWCMSWCMSRRQPSRWMRAAPSRSCD